LIYQFKISFNLIGFGLFYSGLSLVKIKSRGFLIRKRGYLVFRVFYEEIGIGAGKDN